MVKKVVDFFAKPEKRMIFFAKIGLYNRMDDKKFLEKQFKNVFGYRLNLESPQTFNEKIQWLKLYDRNDLYTNLVDKEKVKYYVEKKIGKEYLINTIDVWKTFDQIDFSKLPQQFVLKCTHDSGGVVICKNKEKFDFKKAEKKLNKALKINYFYQNREWPYKNVIPKIICEEYLEDENQADLIDYKFLCCNGVVKSLFVCTERRSKKGLAVDFYDREWNHMPVQRHYRNSEVKLKKPKNFSLMIELAEKLSENIPFVRVDFYEVNNKVYFGEMTFYPGSGFEEFSTLEQDKLFGDMIDLPERRTE